MALDTGILAGMTALTKIFCPDLVGSLKMPHEQGLPTKAGQVRKA